MRLPRPFGPRRTEPLPAACDLFTLRTGCRTWLAVRPGEAEVSMAQTVTPQTALIACIPRGAPQASFLLAPDGRPIAIEGDGMSGPAIGVRCKRVPDGRVEFRHPVAPVRHLGVVTGARLPKPDRVLFDRVGDRVLDRFELHPTLADTLAPRGRAVLAELARAVGAPMSADTLMALLRAGQVRPALAEALVRVLGADELAVLARRLMARPDDLALLRRAMPGDPYLATHLPRLLAWAEAGRPATRRTVSPAGEEHVSVLQSAALRPQAGLALTALARRTLQPRRLSAVLATARNEGPYVLDWLAHHRAAGFDHVVIYSNDNDDGSDELLGRLADQGEITWVRNELSPTARAQWKAYGHAFKALPDLVDYRWTMVLDLDEYVGFDPKMFGSIADVIGWHEYQHVDAIALRWLIFAAGPDAIWQDAPSTRRFTRREAAVNPLFKSLVRSNQFWDSHCHFPFPSLDMPFSYRIEDGAPCHHMGRLRGIKVPQDEVSAELAWVAHHAFRSGPEALMKVARGDATWSAANRAEAERSERIFSRFLALARDPGLVADARTWQCAPALDAHLQRLRTMPGVAASDRAIKAGYAVASLAQTGTESATAA